jgi:hypothetical protein
VLAVFEGLISIIPAMRIFHAVAVQRPKLRFLVRCHPDLPIERLAALSGINFGSDEAVDASRQVTLDAAIAEADAVVYVSSTAVLYALYGGRPIIKIENDILDDDPLTGCSAFKWRAANADEVLSALDEIDRLSPDRAAAAVKAARAYLDDYMRAPSPETMAPFFSSASAERSVIGR